MQATAGDRIVVRSPHVGQPDRHGEVLEVRGANGEPPFLVRWDGGSEGLCFPGPDAEIEPAPSAR